MKNLVCPLQANLRHYRLFFCVAFFRQKLIQPDRKPFVSPILLVFICRSNTHKRGNTIRNHPTIDNLETHNGHRDPIFL